MKKTDTSKLQRMDKFYIVTIIINIVIILFLIISFILMYNSHETEKNGTVEGMDEQAVAGVEESDMTGIYIALLENTTFKIEEDMFFRFGSDGDYSGYYDADNTDVSGYSYDIVLSDSGDYMLLIYNTDQTKSVSYSIDFDEEGNIVLQNPDLNGILTLTF